jgi:phage-related protein
MFNWLAKNKDIVVAIAVPLLTFINIIAGFLIIKKITTAFAMLNAVMMANPIVLIIAAIVALVAGFMYLWNNCEGFRKFWIGLWNGIVGIVVGAWEWIKGLFTGVIDFVSNNWQALLLFLVNPFAGAFKLLYDNCEGFRNFVNGFVNAVVNFFKSIPGKLVSFAQGIVNVFTSIPGKMMNVGKNIAQGLWNGISGLKDWVINKVKNFGKSILNSIKNVLGIHSPSTEFAMIGKFSVLGYTEELDKMTKTVQGQIAETFSVSPQLANSSALHYSPSVNTTVNVNQTQDPLGRMVNDIKTFSGGAKNDYNYGMGVS